MEKCHLTQVGATTSLIILNLSFFRQVSLARLATNSASRKLLLLLTKKSKFVKSQLTGDDLLQIRKMICCQRIFHKHDIFLSTLNMFSMKCYSLSPLEGADWDERRFINNSHFNKEWYVSDIKTKSNVTNGKEMAELLNQLEYPEIMAIMLSSNFNKSFIRHCIYVDDAVASEMKREPPIVTASIECLLKAIENISNKIPKPHQVYNPVEREQTMLEIKYTSDLKELFREDGFFNLICTSASNISSYTKTLIRYPCITIPENAFKDKMKFAVICLECVNYLTETDINYLYINLMEILVNAANEIFRYKAVNHFLLNENHTWFNSSVNSIFNFVLFLLKNDNRLPFISKHILTNNIQDLETATKQTVYQLYVLVNWLFEVRTIETTIPNFLYQPIKSIIIHLSRFPLVNSYILIPTQVWKTGLYNKTGRDIFKAGLTPFSINFLQDMDTLEEYIFRISLLGWISKKQFEETWMYLLSVLGPSMNYSDSVKLNFNLVHTTRLAIQAITDLLLQTLYHPKVGYSNISNFIHAPRNMNYTRIEKLWNIKNNFQYKYKECILNERDCKFTNDHNKLNFEKLSANYSYGQIAIRYLVLENSITRNMENEEENNFSIRKRSEYLEENSLDITSCLQFLLDYYTQILKTQSLTNAQVCYEVMRSVTMVSDLFTDRCQFIWMRDTFLDLSNIQEDQDELSHQFIIIGLCKAAGILNSDLETYEHIGILLKHYLQSQCISSRLVSLQGILYLLEGCILSTVPGNLSEGMKIILPCAVEYVQININTKNWALKKSQKHSLLVWSLAFFLMEYIEDDSIEQNVISNTLLSAFDVLGVKSTSPIQFVIIKGIERLLLLKKSFIIEKHTLQIMKLALMKIKHNNPKVAILGTQLLLTCMYTVEEHLQTKQISMKVHRSPENLVLTMEELSAIFERIKKGHLFEVEFLCFVLSSILKDMFSASEIFAKVIGEFLSPQQPHPQIFSKVVFQVFQSAVVQDQLCLLQDWVVFNISNFISSFSLGMAMWCLTCFFLSASSNKWLRSYFPYIQGRIGRCEYEDKKLLCISGADFYNHLLSSNQRERFIANFDKVKYQLDSPFNELLLSL